METYKLTICGLSRELPVVQVSKKMRMANFSLLGDVELVDALADYLAEKLKTYSFDYLVCPEVKVVPLVHGIAKRLGQKRYVVCRKSIKPYMVSPTILKPLDHFPKHVQPLVINGIDGHLIAGKRVVVIDAVTSTGVTLRMMKKLMEKVEATVVATVAVLKQGKQFDDIENFFSVSELPIFFES